MNKIKSMKISAIKLILFEISKKLGKTKPTAQLKARLMILTSIMVTKNVHHLVYLTI